MAKDSHSRNEVSVDPVVFVERWMRRLGVNPKFLSIYESQLGCKLLSAKIGDLTHVRFLSKFHLSPS
jgi:hypothetical protein